MSVVSRYTVCMVQPHIRIYCAESNKWHGRAQQRGRREEGETDQESEFGRRNNSANRCSSVPCTTDQRAQRSRPTIFSMSPCLRDLFPFELAQGRTVPPLGNCRSAAASSRSGCLPTDGGRLFLSPSHARPRVPVGEVRGRENARTRQPTGQAQPLSSSRIERGRYFALPERSRRTAAIALGFASNSIVSRMASMRSRGTRKASVWP